MLWEGDRGSAQARERFLGGDEVHDAVRAGVLASWQRCRASGLSAEHTELPYDPDLDGEERLLLASLPVLERLHEQLLGSRVSVLLTDGRARVMDRRAGEPDLDRYLDAVQLAPGFGWAEHDAGTNGIGTVLAEGYPAIASAWRWAEEHGVRDLPLLAALHRIIWEDGAVPEALGELVLSV